MASDLREELRQTRTVLKGEIRSLRSTLVWLSQLEERIRLLEDAQPEEAQRGSNGFTAFDGDPAPVWNGIARSSATRCS